MMVDAQDSGLQDGAARPLPVPRVFEQATQGGGAFVLLGLLLPVVAALMTPFCLVAAELASDPAARAILAERPLIGIKLLAALALLIWMFGWPLAHLALRGLERRRITIADGRVHSTAVGSFGTPSWSEPLARYAGVAHGVRTSLSEVRHELVLVHRQPSRSLVLKSAPEIPRETVAAVAQLFAVAEIPSREAASFTPLHGYFHIAELRPRLAA